MPYEDPLALPHVNVRLAVGDEQHLVAGQLVAEHGAQPLGGPDCAALHVATARVDLAQQRAHFPHERLQFGVSRRVERLNDPLAAKERAYAVHPAAPRQVRDQYGNQRDDDAEQDEETDQVPARIRAAPVDEAHVVDEHQRPDAGSLRGQREPGDVQRTRRELAKHVGIGSGASNFAAAETHRVRRRLVGDVALRIAVRDRV